MNQELSFQRYLSAKRTVDDRALNRLVWKALEDRLAAMVGNPMLQVLELGGGVGTMFESLSINYDGLTAFVPVIDRSIDERNVVLYHRTMNGRLIDGRLSGNNRTGRKMCTWLIQAGLRVLQAGRARSRLIAENSSSWHTNTTFWLKRGE